MPWKGQDEYSEPRVSLHPLTWATGHGCPLETPSLSSLFSCSLSQTKAGTVLGMTEPRKDGENWAFSVSRLQHIFMSALISAREVFLLNELVVIPVRLKLPLTLCYPIRVFQKALTPIITLQGFVHYRPSSEVQGKVFTNCYTLCQLTPQKLIFPHSILW